MTAGWPPPVGTRAAAPPVSGPPAGVRPWAGGPQPTPAPAPAVRDRRMARVVLVVAALVAVYAVGLLVAVVGPRVGVSEPVIGFLAASRPALPRVVLRCAIAGWVVALIAGLAAVALRRPGPHPRGRTWLLQVTVVAALLAPYVVFAVGTVADDVPALLVCVPSTAFALWLVQRMQRFRRMPGWVVLAGFGWGVLVASGFGGVMNTWYLDSAYGLFGPDEDLLRWHQRVNTGSAFAAATFEELGKAAGIAVVFILVGRHVNGVVSGLVVGAAVGLGFNFAETADYMGGGDGGVATFQYWMRQSVGLLAAHTAFSAVAGAGFGVARQLARRRLRYAVIGCGVLAAIGGHAVSNIVFRWYGLTKQQWLAPDPAVDALVFQPLLLLLVQGPIVAAYLLLLRAGLRSQAGGLAIALTAEARTGSAGFNDAEVSILLDPARRARVRFGALRGYGVAAFRAVHRLHAAQLDLAVQRWHRSRHEADPLAPRDEELRQRVRRRRAEVRAAVEAAAARRTRVSA